MKVDFDTVKPERHNGMKCLDCKTLIYRKSECSKHKGHDVVYLDKSGVPEK